MEIIQFAIYLIIMLIFFLVLFNQKTFILYHLPNITQLDMLSISEEAKQYAEATFMKKKMYYNMRIKTMQRIFSTL